MKLVKKGFSRLVEVSILESPPNSILTIKDHHRFAKHVIADKNYCVLMFCCYGDDCIECHDIFIKKYKLPRLK